MHYILFLFVERLFFWFSIVILKLLCVLFLLLSDTVLYGYIPQLV